jgi:hypothetical protein
MNGIRETVIPAKRSAERESSSKGGARGWIPAVASRAGMTIAEAPLVVPASP